jgi:hypothetical protein
VNKKFSINKAKLALATHVFITVACSWGQASTNNPTNQSPSQETDPPLATATPEPTLEIDLPPAPASATAAPSPEQASPPASATATPIPSPEEASPPASEAQAFNFTELNYIGVIPYEGRPCLGTQDSPELKLKAWNNGRSYLCIYGFTPVELIESKPLRFRLYQPGGELVEEQIIYYSPFENYIPMYFSLDFPQGEWQATLTDVCQDQLIVQNGFNYFNSMIGDQPYLSLQHEFSGDVPSPADIRRVASYKPGETMILQGVNFPAGVVIPIGIYTREFKKLIPHQGETVTTDNNGEFSLKIVLDSSLGDGEYRVVPILDPTQGEDYRPKLMQPFQVVANPTATPEPGPEIRNEILCVPDFISIPTPHLLILPPGFPTPRISIPVVPVITLQP